MLQLTTKRLNTIVTSLRMLEDYINVGRELPTQYYDILHRDGDVDLNEVADLCNEICDELNHRRRNT